MTNPLPKSPASYLRQVFLDRKVRNPSYSTRAFARDLGISQTLLSLIFNGKRHLSVKNATQAAVLLGLSEQETRHLLDMALLALPERSAGVRKFKKLHARKISTESFQNYEVERFKILSHWYHVAILDLVSTRGFRPSPRWIARRLGISAIEARDALERLIDLGFLEKREGALVKPDRRVYFATQKSEPAVRQFHRQMIAKAGAALDNTAPDAFNFREISGITVAARKDRIAEAKRRIQIFQKDLATFLSEGECEEVFQINVQLFPLTQPISRST